MKKLLSILILFSCVHGFSQTTTTVNSTKKTKELRIAIVQEWNDFNPTTISLASTQALLHMVLRKMTLQIKDGSIVPELASKIPKLQGLMAEWTIHPKAKWGDGQPVICADWKLAWEIGHNPNVSIGDSFLYKSIESIQWNEKTPQKCLVKYSKRIPSYMRDIPPVVPSHLEKEIYEKHKDQPESYQRNSLYVSQPTNPGLYNGPYVVTESKLGSHLIFARNPYFYGQQPQIEKIIVKFIPDSGGIKAFLNSGEVDMVSPVGFTIDQSLMLDEESQKNPNTSYVVHFRKSVIFQNLSMNLADPILANQNIRAALSYSVDKALLVKSFFKNKVLPAETIFAPQDPNFIKRPSSYNPKLAEKILEKEGWIKGADGLRYKNGQKLSFVFSTSAGLKNMEVIQGFIADSWKKVGIDIRIKNQPPRVLLGDSIYKGTYTIAMFGQQTIPDQSLKALYHSSSIPTDKNAWSGANVQRWKSERADKLIEQFDEEWSLSKRQKLTKEVELFIHQEIPLIPIYHRIESAVLPRTLKNFEDDMSGTDLIYPEKWVW